MNKNLETIKQELDVLNEKEKTIALDELTSIIEKQKESYEKDLEYHKKLLKESYNTINDLTQTLSNTKKILEGKVEKEAAKPQELKELKDF